MGIPAKSVNTQPIDDFPTSHLLARFELISQKDTELMSWYDMSSRRIGRIKAKVKGAPRRFGKIRRARLEIIYDKHKSNVKRRFKQFWAISEEFTKDLIREQAKYVARGYSFSEKELSLFTAHTADERFFKPIYVGSDIQLKTDDNASVGFQIPIVFDERSKIIKIGNMDIDKPLISYKGANSANAMLWKAIRSNGFSIPSFACDSLRSHKVLSWFFGSKSDTFVRKLSYYLWISECKDIANRFCRLGKDLSPAMIVRLFESKGEIDKAIAHDEQHIIPPLMFFNSSLGEIKSYLGTTLWKKIANNSISRNDLLFKSLYKFDQFYVQKSPDSESDNEHIFKKNSDHGVTFTERGFEYSKPHLCNTKKVLEFLIDIPSSLLRNTAVNTLFSFDYESKVDTRIVKWVVSVAKANKLLGTRESLGEYATLYKDTKMMAETLGVPFSTEWSLRRMNEMHNHFLRETAKLKYPHVDFQFEHPWAEKIECNGVTAILLKTSSCLVIEGIDLRHCVANYIGFVTSGNCIIYSLTDHASGLRSTLQIIVDKKVKAPHMGQNLGLYNLPIPDKEAADRINLAAKKVLAEAQIIQSKGK